MVSTSEFKFLFVIDNLSTGGAQRQLVNLALGLAGRKHRVELFCYATGDLLALPLYEAGISVHRHSKRGRFSPGVILALRNLIEKGQYDLVLSYLTTPNFYGLVAGRLLQRRRIPVVVSERFCDLPGGVGLLERSVRQLYRFASHVVVNSHHQRMNLAHKYPVLRNRLSTVYNGLDLQVFIPPASEPDNNHLRILTIASVSPYKNGLCLIEALNILRQEYGLSPSVTWIGQRAMSGEHLEYQNEMEKRIRAYHLEDRWQWLGPRTDVVAQLHQHDVLAHPSYGEGLPNVVCEALACARPVIVSDVLDHPRLVQHGESGYLFNWREPLDLAEKIKMLSELTPEERREMGLSGRRFAESHLSLNGFVDEYERLFSNLVTS
jgi:GalNAc-alpha-(1->4)-GalNAc-alpha-(1->3)-diNAcBac-PP-undecaprenol alpha-1,4-N-acetyl-D-galactosaminyltransferase